MDSAARGPLMLLVVDGSVGEGCVAVLWLDGASAGRLESAAATTPQQPLVARAATLLPDEASRSRLVAVLTGVGPGSYTGVRAAASLALGVASALDIPLLQVASDRALVLACAASGQSTPIVLPLGTREALVVDEEGSRIADRSDAPSGADLERLGAHVPAALVRAAADSIDALRSCGWRDDRRGAVREVAIRYPAAPRGAVERGLS